ncbi:hypothetical protein [Angelakisella massiliensis]|uniref:hypothetical protein n=1 Tax=Angelakisella massiliensis TaxID=1871018 RepID=UPI0008F8E5A5|nr:hypothetical protein [Angelakisella massiliensis]
MEKRGKATAWVTVLSQWYDGFIKEQLLLFGILFYLPLDKMLQELPENNSILSSLPFLSKAS